MKTKELHPQLAAVIDDYAAATSRLQTLVAETPEGFWAWRPAPNSWSMAECVAHLNLMSEQFIPSLRSALHAGRKLKLAVPPRYRRDPVGWALWRVAGPPVHARARTKPQLIPAGPLQVRQLLTEFETLQGEQIALVRQGNELPLHRLWMHSPVDPELRYTVYSCFTILPRHQHRHLWQAERALQKLRETEELRAG